MTISIVLNTRHLSLIKEQSVHYFITFPLQSRRLQVEKVASKFRCELRLLTNVHLNREKGKPVTAKTEMARGAEEREIS